MTPDALIRGGEAKRSVGSVLDPYLRHLGGVVISGPRSGERHTEQCPHVMRAEASTLEKAHQRSGTPAIGVRLIGSRLDLPLRVLSHAHRWRPLLSSRFSEAGQSVGDV